MFLEVPKYNFRIGCFTSSFDDEFMWNKYAGGGTGFIVKYNTQNDELFTRYMYRVIYQDGHSEYDISPALAIFLAFDGNIPNGYKPLENKVDRITWNCAYIKNSDFSKEKEYRLSIPPYYVLTGNFIEGTKCTIDINDNISLMSSIEQIYIGRNISNIGNYKDKLSFIERVTNSMGISYKLM